MKIFKFSIPIVSYCGDDVFEQCIYFSGSKPFPTKEQLVEKLKELHVRDSQYPEYVGSWEECIKSVEKAEGYPTLSGNLAMTNTFTEVTLNNGTSVRHSFSVETCRVY